MKTTIAFLAGALLGASALALLRPHKPEAAHAPATHTARMPAPTDSAVVGAIEVELKAAAEAPDAVSCRRQPQMADAAAQLEPMLVSVPGEAPRCVLPITQKAYAGDDYRAWVSGYMPQLDSITITHPAPKRWHAGVTAGCAFTPRGPEPYVGVGITYSFFSW